jgi:hypothetical protein
MAEVDPRRKWEYTLEDIADAAGLSVHTVRDHKVKGYLIPGNFLNTCRYVVGNRMTLEAKRETVEDAWGGEHGKSARHEAE